MPIDERLTPVAKLVGALYTTCVKQIERNEAIIFLEEAGSAEATRSQGRKEAFGGMKIILRMYARQIKESIADGN